jgi:PAS domain S-box-containing protein
MTIVLFNQAAQRMFGYAPEDAIGQPIDKLIPARFREVHHGHIQKFSSDDNVKNRTLHPMREIFGVRADGSEFPIDSTISRAWIGGQLQLTAVLRDVTVNRIAEKELRQANQQLRELSSSLQMVREKERTRISRELHDDLGQQLTGLKLSLSWLGSRIKEGRETAAKNVDDMRTLLDGAIASVRRIASELRPRILDELNFSDALTWQTQEFVKHSGLHVDLHLSAGHRIGNGEISTSLFRIAQEALTNVVRHAQATTVTISLVEDADHVVLSIADDGVGLVANPAKMGIGLLSMRERSIAIGASFEISGNSGRGTTIVVTLPLANLAAEVRTV